MCVSVYLYMRTHLHTCICTKWQDLSGCFPDLELVPCHWQHCVTSRLREQARSCCLSRPRHPSARPRSTGRPRRSITFSARPARSDTSRPSPATVSSLMIAEAIDPDRAAPGSASRLRFAMQPGQVAVVGSEEGAEMLLT